MGQALYLNYYSKNMCAIKYLDVGWMMFLKKWCHLHLAWCSGIGLIRINGDHLRANWGESWLVPGAATDLHVRHGLEYMHRAIRRGSTNFNHQKFLPRTGGDSGHLLTRWIQLSCYSLCSCWSNEPRKKKTLTFHYAGCLTGILLL